MRIVASIAADLLSQSKNIRINRAAECVGGVESEALVALFLKRVW
jgi:hypothetical protein